MSCESFFFYIKFRSRVSTNTIKIMKLVYRHAKQTKAKKSMLLQRALWNRRRLRVLSVYFRKAKRKEDRKKEKKNDIRIDAKTISESAEIFSLLSIVRHCFPHLVNKTVLILRLMNSTQLHNFVTKISVFLQRAAWPRLHSRTPTREQLTIYTIGRPERNKM